MPRVRRAELAPRNPGLREGDALELRAWRFLAAHRATPGLAATHVAFISEDQQIVHVNTPRGKNGTYVNATGRTWGEAAISLARQLGMPR